MVQRDLGSQRVDYGLGGLVEDEAPGSPYDLFLQWYDAAAHAEGEPNAMVLSTVGEDGAPSSRTVLLKGQDEDGFVFFTNYESRKAAELAHEPRCALLFPWYAAQRQVRIEGTVEQVSTAESDGYFATRPRDSQLGAWASPQSRSVGSRAELDDALAEVTARFEGVEVPRPPHWGGYRVSPSSIEFWQGRSGRMHDRLLYRRTPEGWATVRLAP